MYGRQFLVERIRPLSEEAGQREFLCIGSMRSNIIPFLVFAGDLNTHHDVSDTEKLTALADTISSRESQSLSKSDGETRASLL